MKTAQTPAAPADSTRAPSTPRSPRSPQRPPPDRRRRLVLAVGLTSLVGLLGVAFAQQYQAADVLTRPPPSRTEVLPERFLRGFDPITVTFVGDVAKGPGPADDVENLATITPAWPGAWTFVDKRTLQFRPAEPWPPLQRFAVKARGTTAIRSTMMAAPTSMHPTNGAVGLPPFRTFTLTFAQPLPDADIKKMIALEIRALPGLKDSARRPIDQFSLALLPRVNVRDAATYALSFDDEIPEGSMLVVTVALALGDEDTTLWTGRASTRTDFRLEAFSCANQRVSVVGSPVTQGDAALDCGHGGEVPQLIFSAPVGTLSLTALKALVRLEPAVADLHPEVFGKRVQLSGRFVPDTLYKLRIGDAPVFDDLGRRLSDPGEAITHFFVGWKKPFLRLKRGEAVMEQKGPRMVPMTGYGDRRADLRIHRIDPRHPGLWPFPESPVLVDENSDPPFPGEEPGTVDIPGAVSRQDLVKHLRLLGAPQVSTVVNLPLDNRGGAVNFGLDLGPLLDGSPAIGKRRPGTYLVGVRRLEGAPERAWARVQITNLSLTAVEERSQAVFFVTSLDTAAPVSGANIVVEAVDEKSGKLVSTRLTTDGEGRAAIAPVKGWRHLVRLAVEKGDDVLVIDPKDPPPRFFNNHWSSSAHWLQMLCEPIPEPKNEAELGFLFTERPIYRPGEKVFLKGFAREKRDGVLVMPRARPARKDAPPTLPSLTIKVTSPTGDEVPLKTTTSALFGAEAVFDEKSPPTGWYTARLFVGQQQAPLATRRFQIEAYRVPTFEVQLAGPSRARLDQPFSVQALARYYAGGNVADQAIRWNVTRRSAWHTPKGREGFLFASSSQFARPENGPRSEQTSREASLDATGADSIEMHPEKDLDGSPRLYRFEATVTGADDQEVSAVTEVLALPPFVLGMKLDRYKKTATSITPEIIAVGVDDALLANQKIEVRLYQRTWHSHLRESHFATGEASYVTEQEDSLLEKKTISSTSSPLKLALPTKGAGVYVVELVARDRLGRVQTLSADLYIGGEEPVSWQKGQAGVFELVPDKKAYAPGETANVVVKSPFQTGRALVVVEEVGGNRYRHLDIKGGQATVTVPIERSATPNLPIHVVLERGRLGDSADGGNRNAAKATKTAKADDAPWRPQTMAASIDLEVTPTKNSLAVVVEHPEQTRPGSTVDMTVRLKRDDGQGVGGEVTLWLVDEAVLALATEGTLDPLTSLITRNARDTSVWNTRNSVVGRLMEDEVPGGDGADERLKDGEGSAKRRVRRNFQTVPYYQATLQVPASGVLKVPVTVSDDLTNFKVRAVAVSGAERFGRFEDRLKVRLPIIVQPQLPRFVRQGDRFDGGGVARLVEGEGGPGVVKADYSGPVVERKRSKSVTLEKDKALSVTFPVEVAPSANGEALTVKMEVLRKKDGVGDAFEVALPVFPDVEWQHFSQQFDITSAKKAVPAPAEKVRSGTARQTVVATNVAGLLEVQSALRYLSAYPHGCLEQKLAQLSPDLMLAKLSKRLGAFALTPASRRNIERFLQELPQHQDDQGLFGFWPGTSGSIQLTGPVVEFAAQAKAAGILVDDAVIERAREGLKRSLRSDTSWDAAYAPWRAPLSAATLLALARSGSTDDAYLADLVRSRQNLDGVGRARLAEVLARGDRSVWSRDLTALTTELWDSVTFNRVDGVRTAVGLNDPRARWGGRVLGSSTSSLATVFQALVTLDPTNKDLPLLLDGLLRQARGKANGFGSTWDNRAAVEAIVTYLDKAIPDIAATSLTLGTTTVILDGAKKVAQADSTASAPMTVVAKGPSVRGQVAWRYLPETPGDRLDGSRQGFLVERSASIYGIDGSQPRRVDDSRAQEQRFVVGDIVELHARITNDSPRSHVALVVPFAAGFEPLNPELQTSSSEAKPVESDSLRPSYVARLDHEVRYYFDDLPKGTFTFHLRVRAITPGSFTHPGVRANLMYDEAVSGRSPGMRVIVEKAPEGTKAGAK